MDDANGGRNGRPSAGRGGSGGLTDPEPDPDAGRGLGGDNSTPGAAGVGSSGGEVGGNGSAGSTTSCEDLTADLCMTLTWPAGTVPYRRDAGIGEELWTSVQAAMGLWEGAPVWDSTLEFVGGSSPIGPYLVFDLDAGCGVTRRSADALMFALSSCSDTAHIARELGVALGLPRVHQRSDRDRYLDMADRQEFDCTKGEFFDRCPREGELGVFTTHSLMFAPAPSTASPDACALEPLGGYLYLPSNVEVDPPLFDACESFSRSYAELMSSSSFDWMVLAELYAASRGWTPLAPIGWQAATPWDTGEPLPMNATRQPAVIEADGTVAAYVLDFDNTPWRTEDSENGWTEWQAVAATRDIQQWTLLPVPGSSAVDVFITSYSDSQTLHARFGDEAPGDWIALGPAPPPASGNLAAVRGDAGSVTLYAFPGLFLFGEPPWTPVHTAETDGHTLSSWEPLPDGVLANPGGSAAGRGAEHHVVTPIVGNGIAYIAKNESRWSEWATLAPSLGPIHYTAIAMTPAGRLEVVAMTVSAEHEGNLWHLSCASDCSSPNRWTKPVVIGGVPMPWGIPESMALAAADTRLDIVAMIHDGTNRGLWHKRWQPLDAAKD
jgi:hypothetical protein